MPDLSKQNVQTLKKQFIILSIYIIYGNFGYDGQMTASAASWLHSMGLNEPDRVTLHSSGLHNR
jgi:hypothetical protein